RYLDPSFFQHRIHWFSIFNSFMMVIFLVGLVWMILLRTLSKDYARLAKECKKAYLSKLRAYNESSDQLCGQSQRFCYVLNCSTGVRTDIRVYIRIRMDNGYMEFRRVTDTDG
uniref:Transmembrane 9 superfamily member n=1 Tax=Globodera pallida TaxID=36090 RepID=A0A183CRP0_GLOPA